MMIPSMILSMILSMIPPMTPSMIRIRPAVLALALLLLPPGAGRAEEIPVAGPADLARALQAAKGGERLLLADGDYGTLQLRPAPGSVLGSAPGSAPGPAPATGPNADPDMHPDVAPNADPDLGPDLGPDMHPDAGPDAGPDLGPAGLPQTPGPAAAAATGRGGADRPPVTVAAAHPGGARFRAIDLRGAHGLVFDGIAVAEGFSAGYGASGITLRQATARELAFRDASGIRIEGNRIGGGRFGLTLFSVQDFAILGNSFRDCTEDLVQISRASRRGLIEGNAFLDTSATGAAHPDLLQIYGRDGMTPGEITIRGNHFYDDPATGAVPAQGIFLVHPGGAGFQDILIEQNLVSVRHVNAIYVEGGQARVVIRDNSLIAGPEGMKGGIIRLARGREGFDNAGTRVEGNIAARILDETGRGRAGGGTAGTGTAGTGTAGTGTGGVGVGDNYLYGPTTGRLFSGDGREGRDFFPASGTAVPRRLERYGARSGAFSPFRPPP